MPETKAINSTAIDLVDESFDPKKNGTYHLSILWAAKTVAYAILDTQTNKYLALHYSADNNRDILVPFSTEGLTSLFKSVSCAIAHNKFTLIPSALFDEENKESLLRFTHPVGKDEKIHSDKLQNLDARNLFTISKSSELLIREKFPNVHFMHSATSFIESLLIRNKNNTGKKVFANFNTPLSSGGGVGGEAGYFEIAIFDGRELLFSNAFKYKTSEDIAYYILFVYEQLGLNPEEIELVLSGAIEKTAKEHSLLYNYIRNVKFATRPDSFNYSYKFDEVPSHNFWSLFTQYLCV